MIEQSYQTHIAAVGSWHYLPVPEPHALTFREAGHKRVLCSLNGEEPFHCALARQKDRGYYIMLSKRRLKEHNLERGDEADVQLTEDRSEYQAPMPEALDEVLKSDFEGYEVFQSLTPGKQRSIIHMIRRIKSMDLQIERALTIIENLKLGIRNNKDLTK